MRVPEESHISCTRLFAGRLDPTVPTKSQHVKHKLKHKLVPGISNQGEGIAIS